MVLEIKNLLWSLLSLGYFAKFLNKGSEKKMKSMLFHIKYEWVSAYSRDIMIHKS